MKSSTVNLHGVLRVGMAMCFIGHGSYGILTKAAWLPYFAVAGVTEPLAWRLMPWIGAMDIAVGFLAFVWPSRALFAWAAAWCVWTALLRPLAGEGWPEFFERAGNYGVPIAMLAAVGFGGSWLARLPERWAEPDARAERRLHRVLRLTVFLLLAGHAGCALLLQKPALAHHYEVLGVADTVQTMIAVGCFEAGLALAVLVAPSRALLLFVVGWKIVTESLFLTSGATAPFFELVERGGSYIAPLALACLLHRPTLSPAVPSTSTVRA